MADKPEYSFWWKLVHLEPALIRAFVMATVLLAGWLGLSVATDVPDALIAWVSTTFLLIQALWTRSAVTANARVAVMVPDPVNAPDTVAPGAAVTYAPAEAVAEAATTSGS